MRKLVPVFVLLTGCPVNMHHPYKSSAEQQRDLDECKSEAVGRSSTPYGAFDPVTFVKECLARRGYQPNR